MCWITDDESECSVTSSFRSPGNNRLDSHGADGQEGLNVRNYSDSGSSWPLVPDLTCPLCAGLLRWGGTHHGHNDLASLAHSESQDKMRQQAYDQCKANSHCRISQASDVAPSGHSLPPEASKCSGFWKASSHASSSHSSESWITDPDSSSEHSLDSDTNCSRSDCVDSACLDHTVALFKLQSSSERGCRICDLIFRGAQCFLTSEQRDRLHERRLRLMYGSTARDRFSVCDRGKTICTFSFFHLPGQRPPLPFVAESNLIENTASQQSLFRAKEWIHECIQTHTNCRRKLEAPLPKRVLDLGHENTEQDLKLYETKNESAQYVCLSHCWGNSRPPILTMKDTLLSNQRSIAFEALPRTFKDAVVFTRGLSIRYLWIDSMCIIQDDDEDWQKESQKMATIYADAYLTIGATSAPNDDHGFHAPSSDRYEAHKLELSGHDERMPHPIYVRRPWPHYHFANKYGPDDPTGRQSSESSLSYSESDDSRQLYRSRKDNRDRTGNTSKELPEQNMPSKFDPYPLLSRAWVYQEFLLSARFLHVTFHELAWECREIKTCECLEGEAASESTKRANSTTDAMTDLRWRELVTEYSGLALTMERDKLPALAGLANEMLLIRHSRYLAGLWEDTLIEDLCWYTAEPQRRPEAWIAPSWSWASTKSTIYFDLIDDSKTHCATVIDVKCLPLASHSTGAVKSGYLTLKGSTLEAEIRCKTKKRNEGTKEVSLHIAGQKFKLGISENDTFFGFYPTTEIWLDNPIGDAEIGSTTVQCFLIARSEGQSHYLILRRGLGPTDVFTRIGYFTYETAFFSDVARSSDIPDGTPNTTITII